jgi:hypothetical protein
VQKQRAIPRIEVDGEGLRKSIWVGNVASIGQEISIDDFGGKILF